MSSQSIGNTGSILSGAEISQTEQKLSLIPAVVRIAQVIKAVTDKQQSLDVPSITITGAITTTSGSCGGSVSTDTDSTTSNFSATFDDYCQEIGGTQFHLSGRMSMTDDTFTYSQLRMRSPGLDMSMNGNITFISTLGNNSSASSFVTNMDARDNLTGDAIRLENYEVSANINSENFYIDISGRIYLSSYGYVDIETISPISFDALTGETSGKIKFTGQNSSVTLEFVGNGLFSITIENSGRVVSSENVSFDDIFSEL